MEDASNWLSPSSLLSTPGGDSPPSLVSSDFNTSNISANDSNSVDNLIVSAPDVLQGSQYIQQVLFRVCAQQEAFQEATRLTHAQHQQIKSEALQRRQIQRMQQFLESGDPILMAEAMAWAQVNPGVLQLPLINFEPLSEPSEPKN